MFSLVIVRSGLSTFALLVWSWHAKHDWAFEPSLLVF